jgi:hypothetical protein
VYERDQRGAAPDCLLDHAEVLTHADDPAGVPVTADRQGDPGPTLGQVDEDPGPGRAREGLLAERALSGPVRGGRTRPLLRRPAGEGGDQLFAGFPTLHTERR